MEYMQNQLSWTKLPTSENSILSAWKSLVSMLTRGVTGFVRALRRYFGLTSWRKYTITIISHGRSLTMAKTYGLYAKGRRLICPACAVSLAVRWETIASSLKEWKALNQRVHFIPPSTEPGALW